MRPVSELDINIKCFIVLALLTCPVIWSDSLPSMFWSNPHPKDDLHTMFRLHAFWYAKVGSTCECVLRCIRITECSSVLIQKGTSHCALLTTRTRSKPLSVEAVKTFYLLILNPTMDVYWRGRLFETTSTSRRTTMKAKVAERKKTKIPKSLPTTAFVTRENAFKLKYRFVAIAKKQRPGREIKHFSSDPSKGENNLKISLRDSVNMMEYDPITHTYFFLKRNALQCSDSRGPVKTLSHFYGKEQRGGCGLRSIKIDFKVRRLIFVVQTYKNKTHTENPFDCMTTKLGCNAQGVWQLGTSLLPAKLELPTFDVRRACYLFERRLYFVDYGHNPRKICPLSERPDMMTCVMLNNKVDVFYSAQGQLYHLTNRETKLVTSVPKTVKKMHVEKRILFLLHNTAELVLQKLDYHGKFVDDNAYVKIFKDPFHDHCDFVIGVY